MLLRNLGFFFACMLGVYLESVCISIYQVFQLYMEHSCTPIPNDKFYEKMSNQLMLWTLETFNF